MVVKDKAHKDNRTLSATNTFCNNANIATIGQVSIRLPKPGLALV